MCDKVEIETVSGGGKSPAREEEMQKTELREVQARQASERKPDTTTVLVHIAKRAAMETIREEIILFHGLIQDAVDEDAKLNLIERLARMKLQSVGVVLGEMGMKPNEIRRMDTNKKRQG